MIVDGRALSRELLLQVRETISRPYIVRAVTVSPSKATESYLKIKTKKADEAGMRMEVVELPEDSTTDEVIESVLKEGADAVIVQLPLPEHIDATKVVNSIPLSKDADVLSEAAYNNFLTGKGVLPPVVAAVKEIIDRHNVSLEDKQILVVGAGKLVGRPVSTWLTGLGHTVITVRSSEERDKYIHTADIVITGTGKTHSITKDMLKEGVAVIDAGTSESNGAILGDVHPECSEKASLFTPVPGGVGPVAVACLFKNVASLQEGR